VAKLSVVGRLVDEACCIPGRAMDKRERKRLIVGWGMLGEAIAGGIV